MLGRALKQLRLFHRVSQKDLADRLGISNAYLSQIENEQKKNISMDLIDKYAEAFNLEPHHIVRFSDELSSRNGIRRNSDAAEKVLKILEWISDDKEKTT